jgi:dUTP pyrophosphatase
MSDVHVKMFRINPLAKLPAYAHPGDSGMDLATPIDLTLEPGVPLFVDIGVAVAIPPGYEGQIRSRSGLTKRGITACSGLGTVDACYRGSLGVTLLWNMSPDDSDSVLGILAKVARGKEPTFKAGDRIAQLVIAPVATATVEEVDSAEALGETQRGAGGFGSTGLR